MNGASNFEARGLVTRWTNHDDYKDWGGSNGVTFNRCWGARRHSAVPSADPHEDFFQAQGGAFDNGLFYGNVYLTGQSSWWYVNPTAWANQGIYFGGGTATLNLRNTTFQQNMFWHNNGSLKVKNTVVQSGCSATDNTLLTADKRNSWALSNIQSNARNFVVGGNTSGSNVGEGTDGVQVPIGDFQSRDYSVYSNWFAYGIPGQDVSGNLSSPPPSLKAFFPKTGTRLHWGTGGTSLGAKDRTKEIYDSSYRATRASQLGYKLVPGDVGWPVAQPWQEDYNYDGFVTSGYTGTFDANGDNA